MKEKIERFPAIQVAHPVVGSFISTVGQVSCYGNPKSTLFLNKKIFEGYSYNNTCKV